MSSILDALKKLEKEKIHRDEVSTAIASDILRSGNKPKTQQWKIPLALFLFVIIVGLMSLFLFRESPPVAIVQFSNLPPVEVTKPIEPVEPIVSAETIKVPEVAESVKPLPENLPLLSGIVYQQQKEARMAILNDLPVMEGTVIAGYTLQEIFPDHVVLTNQGQSFSLPLNSKN